MDEFLRRIRARRTSSRREALAMSAKAWRLSKEKDSLQDRVLRLRAEVAQLEEVARAVIRMADEAIR